MRPVATMTLVAYGLIALWTGSLLFVAVLAYVAPEMDEEGRITRPGRPIFPRGRAREGLDLRPGLARGLCGTGR